MKFFCLVISSLLLLLSGCHNTASDKPLTQGEIRKIQTRTFERRSVAAVLKEMINVLQDEGYIVKHANLELGLIAAEKEIDIEKGWDKFWSGLTSGKHASWRKNILIEVTANVTSFGDDTKARVNFQRKMFDNNGRVLKVFQIYDHNYYQEFFFKILHGLGMSPD
jgi:hypothetical protein